MRKLLLTMLVALLAVPVFALDNPDLNGDNSLTVPFSNLTADGSDFVSANGQVRVTGYSDGSGYISSLATTARTETTINGEEYWNRPIKSVTLDVKQALNKVTGSSSSTNYISRAYVYIVNSEDEDEYEEVQFTGNLQGLKSGELTVDVSQYATAYPDYKVKISITLAKGAAAGTVQLNSVTYNFFEVSDDNTPTIAWPNGTAAEYSVTIVNPDFSRLPNAATVVPAVGYDVEYTSSDEEVVKIDDFYYKEYSLGKAGTATITATVVNATTREPVKDAEGNEISVSFKLTVVPVSAQLSFASSTASVVFGEAFTAPALTKTVNGVANNDVPVTYESSNTAVATVDATGAVTIVGVGTARITASVANDNYSATPVSYTLTVNPSIKWDANVASTNTINFGESFTFPKAVAQNENVAPVIAYTVTGDAVTYNEADDTFTVVKTGSSTITATGTLNGEVSTLSYTLTVKQTIVSIAFSEKTGTEVYTGDDVALPTLTVKPENISLSGVEYTTNNTNVTVVDGKIHFESGFNYETDGGSIVVTALLPEGNFAEAQTSYTLTLTPAIAWEGVAETEYTGTANTILENAPTAVLKSDKLTLVYETSDDKVATVASNGEVSLVGVGTATITAKAMNGDKEVQSLSYNVKVNKSFDNNVLYLTSEDFATGVSRNPRLYAKVAGTGDEVAVSFTGAFNKANGVVTVTNGSFAAETDDKAKLAYKNVTVNGTGIGAGTLETSLFQDFSIISETISSSNGVFTIAQPMHELYYRLTGVAATTLTDIEFTPADDQTTAENAKAYAVLAVKDGGNTEPNQLKNVEIVGDNFDAASSANEGAYSAGQAVLLNFQPAAGETVYFICMDGANAYAAPIVSGQTVMAPGEVYYECDPAIFPEYKNENTFAIDWDNVSTTVKTTEFNQYEAGQYIRMGEDRSAGLMALYYTVKDGEASALRTITFSNTTGVEDIMVDEEAGEAVYYNLQGVQIAHPAKGQIYVRVMGKKVDKVVF